MDIVAFDPDGEFADVPAAVILEGEMGHLDEVSRHGRILIARQYRLIADLIEGAPRDAEVWVGPDPSVDPSWQPPHDMTLARWRRERAEFAVRAAVADVAIRLHLSEDAVRNRATVADTLRVRCRQVWRRFANGAVTEPNALITARLAQSLPDDEHTWHAFGEAVADGATRLTPAKFRVRARAVRERVHAESVDERHGRAAAERNVWLAPDCDGMAVLTALLPAVDAHAVMERLDASARRLRADADERRTLAQLRADALTDLVVHGAGAMTPASIQASVAITVPVLTLLGASEEPATLDGYGPIDLDTARRLAGGATSWIRVLTHPVTGTVLDVDRTTYRPPADLRRWVERMHPTCAMAGCNRPSRRCDLDHKEAWADGGSTSAEPPAPLPTPPPGAPRHAVADPADTRWPRRPHTMAEPDRAPLDERSAALLTARRPVVAGRTPGQSGFPSHSDAFGLSL